MKKKDVKIEKGHKQNLKEKDVFKIVKRHKKSEVKGRKNPEEKGQL